MTEGIEFGGGIAAHHHALEDMTLQTAKLGDATPMPDKKQSRTLKKFMRAELTLIIPR
ncbi:hypothetical protein G3480_12325 [Thiorhodococcus mannitoliphagus]|uniref:Uncharacterized protein n=1 Tax=Thiorhodococcus mannitoliphagus TaxID=329406 RepID=A0A6P1DTF2_9GAMM|nr:hypothetical protein [Thiorhodococcus mannitoliphagus]NEX21089.1 hypothetical protein [Thiorhodococcus mannitoliphagus]